MPQAHDEVLLKARLGRRALPILCYHRVVPEALPGATINIHVTRGALARQLAQLHRRRMTPITFADLLGDKPLPRRPVILTFDDGYRDNHNHLLPLLEEYDARAVIFALGDRGIRSNVWDSEYGEPPVPLMSDAELRACHASGRVEIGSHGLTHRKLPELSTEDLEHELAASKSALENLIGAAVHAFAYPYGEWGPRERAAVARAGYVFGIATDRGAPLTHNRYAVARRIMFPNTTAFGFYKKTSGWYPHYRRLLGRSA
ncbi:MAG: polysaccharide deacetylase family protein [Gammaproteobacteria bacterium]